MWERRRISTLARTKVFAGGRELLGATKRMAIEEHQAGELGVQRLHYLYGMLKATTAYESQ